MHICLSVCLSLSLSLPHIIQSLGPPLSLSLSLSLSIYLSNYLSIYLSLSIYVLLLCSPTPSLKGFVFYQRNYGIRLELASKQQFHWIKAFAPQRNSFLRKRFQSLLKRDQQPIPCIFHWKLFIFKPNKKQVLRCLEVLLPALLGNYDRPTDRPTNRQTLAPEEIVMHSKKCQVREHGASRESLEGRGQAQRRRGSGNGEKNAFLWNLYQKISSAGKGGGGWKTLAPNR